MSNISDELFGIDEALLQKVTHQGVVVAERRSSEAVVFVGVPLKSRKNLVSVTAAGWNHHFTEKSKADVEKSFSLFTRP